MVGRGRRQQAGDQCDLLVEVSKGIQGKLYADEADVAEALKQALDALKAGCAGRICQLTTYSRSSGGQSQAPTEKAWMDRGMIATAKFYGLILLACNSADMKGRGVEVINPQRDKIGHGDLDGAPVKGGLDP